MQRSPTTPSGSSPETRVTLRFMARGSGNQWLPLVLGLLACGAKRSATDGGTGVIPPDDPGPDCPSNGWCWDNGNDGADASVPAPARLTSAWSSGPNDRWAVGTAGTVLHKVGTTWSPVNVGTNVWLNGIWGTGP